ncbi:Na+/H+ antiporter subunit E [Halomonas sp. GXIMD04776]|uniref:Na+/H+ antiporter subunit E n=1 Tax=Halomonas sp. GXIMD04776 TaxID=3415605 RepID=UPI003CA40966
MIRSRRWLPMPILSILLLVVWLLLQQSIGLGHWLLGGVLALLIPLAVAPFYENPPLLKRPGLMARYIVRVLGDIILANLQVSWIILDPRGRMNPAFIEYPLQLTQNFPITVLASTITLTPGTVSAHLRMSGKSLLIHALDVDDVDAVIHEIHERYERPLMEIFEC